MTSSVDAHATALEGGAEDTYADWSHFRSFVDECWAEDDTAVLVCRQVVEETHDVKTFVLAAENGRYFRFDSGQFITLELEIDGEQVNRCYTISSPPTRPFTLTITVKRVQGQVSNWLHDNVVPGTRLRVKAPLGGFTLPERDSRFLFLSAGSGVTPLMSMIRTLRDLGSNADVVFVHSARTPDDIIFRSELDALASEMPRLRVVHVCEDVAAFASWTGLRGRLSSGMLEVIAPDFLERNTFTCGPPGYMASVRKSLEFLGYDMRRYHEESFNFEALPSGDSEVNDGMGDDSPVVAADSGGTSGYDVVLARSGVTVHCGPDETILDAALAAGIRPPAACSQGMCGTCKTTLLDGEVDMKHNGGIRPKEIAQNKVLICCSRPLADVRIDI